MEQDQFKKAEAHLDFANAMIRCYGHSANRAKSPDEILQFLNWVFEYVLGLEEKQALHINLLAQEVERLEKRLDNWFAVLREGPRHRREKSDKSRARRQVALRQKKTGTHPRASVKPTWPHAAAPPSESLTNDRL